MAITNPKKTTDFASPQFSGWLPPNIAAPYFEEAAKVSVVQSLARKIPLGPNGEAIPYVTSKMQAGWVGQGGQKPASEAGLGMTSLEPKKIAAIAVVSAELVRANPGNYMGLLRPQIAEAFALAFDLAALYDRGPSGTAGGGPFPTWLAQTTKAVSLEGPVTSTDNMHTRVTEVLRQLVRDDGRRLTGFAFDEVVEPEFLSALDAAGRPLYVAAPPLTDTVAAARGGSLIGRPTFMREGVAEPVPGTPETAYTVGFAGDWSKAVWGAVGGISYDVSTQATVTINGNLVSLWENNLLAIRAEAEYGFYVHDPESFVELQLETAAEES